MARYDITIVGGGLAGLTAAIHLSRFSLKVLVIEKSEYPRHKVCGEYVSNENEPYLNWLGLNFDQSFPRISRLRLQTVSNSSIESTLPLGGFGISRFAFDQLLFEKAKEQGVNFKFETVGHIHFDHGFFEVQTNHNCYEANHVLGCFGKRSVLDKRLNRRFIQKKSPWLGIKAHYEYDGFSDDVVALGTFEGGYGGLSKVEGDRVNFCYLASFESFQQIGDIATFNEKIVSKNPMFKSFLENATLSNGFKKPISISQISFDKKEAVYDHILMCGDSAGLIHPLCGNGMAMAIISAKIASEVLLESIEGKWSREKMEQSYAKRWKKEFSRRLWFGRKLQNLILHPTLFDASLRLFGANRRLLPYIISKTHGSPIKLEDR